MGNRSACRLQGVQKAENRQLWEILHLAVSPAATDTGDRSSTSWMMRKYFPTLAGSAVPCAFSVTALVAVVTLVLRVVATWSPAVVRQNRALRHRLSVHVPSTPRDLAGVHAMKAERFYVYRSGSTDACALTRKKGDTTLPPAVAPDRWQFWMQTGRLQAEDGQYGFNLEVALKEIAAKGYSLFTGSPKLLGRPPASAAQDGASNV